MPLDIWFCYMGPTRGPQRVTVDDDANVQQVREEIWRSQMGYLKELGFPSLERVCLARVKDVCTFT